MEGKLILIIGTGRDVAALGAWLMSETTAS